MNGHRSRGFALVVTLWALVGATGLALATAETARDSLGASHNRDNAARAYWAAFGCLERARHAAHRILWPDNASPEVTLNAWTNLDAVLSQLGQSGCNVAIRPAGLTANANGLGPEQLSRFFRAAGLAAQRGDSLADALLDWRDADESPRALGAEGPWYIAQGRAPPRNGLLSTPTELRLIRGYADFTPVSTLMGVEPDRILWTRAPRPVLASLPGMTEEALEVFESRRGQITDIQLIGDFPELPAYARDSLAWNAPAMARSTTSVPEAWFIKASASRGSPPIAVAIELKVALADHRLVTLRNVVLP